MKNFRVLVVVLLLGLAMPFLIHYRAWASGSSLRTQDPPAATKTVAGNAQSANQPPSLPESVPIDLPNANSSLPLLSVIGFGILVGGVLSALRTRQVRK
jgi:hypothetical protein